MAYDPDLNEWHGADLLSAALGEAEASLNARLHRLWQRLVSELGYLGLHRIAVAVYDPRTDQLSTFAATGDQPTPLAQYHAYLHESESLLRLKEENTVRIVHDLSVIPPERQHTQAVASSGFRSSLTVPIIYQGHLYGFVFLNSREPGYFRGEVFRGLLPYARLVSMLGANAIREARIVRGTVGSTIALSRVRDVETSEHMERIGALSRAMAERLAPRAGLDDEYIAMLEHFAPLHDLGKLAIPDDILLKPGALTAEEFARMKGHVQSGLDLLDSMTHELELSGDGQLEVLREVIAYHHERLDGSGYPFGLRDEQIPWSGRIVAVADVFDALTHERPYKEAWSAEQACAVLREEAGVKLCAEAVEALLALLEEQGAHALGRPGRPR